MICRDHRRSQKKLKAQGLILSSPIRKGHTYAQVQEADFRDEDEEERVDILGGGNRGVGQQSSNRESLLISDGSRFKKRGDVPTSFTPKTEEDIYDEEVNFVQGDRGDRESETQAGISRSVDDDGNADEESITRRTHSELQRDNQKYEDVLEIVKGISSNPSSPFLGPTRD